MAEKNTVEVVIDGQIYELSGAKSEAYLHEVAGYLNAKILTFRKEFRNYNKMDETVKALLLQINVCDDLFMQQEKTRLLQKEMEEMEREAYSAKHDLINTQMKLEAALKQLESVQRQLAEYEAREKANTAREDTMIESEDSRKVISVKAGARSS